MEIDFDFALDIMTPNLRCHIYSRLSQESSISIGSTQDNLMRLKFMAKTNYGAKSNLWADRPDRLVYQAGTTLNASLMDSELWPFCAGALVPNVLGRRSA